MVAQLKDDLAVNFRDLKKIADVTQVDGTIWRFEIESKNGALHLVESTAALQWSDPGKSAVAPPPQKGRLELGRVSVIEIKSTQTGQLISSWRREPDGKLRRKPDYIWS